MTRKQRSGDNSSNFAIEGSNISNSFNFSIHGDSNIVNIDDVLDQLDRIVRESGNVDAGIALGSLKSELQSKPRDKGKIRLAWDALRKALPFLDNSTGLAENITSLIS